MSPQEQSLELINAMYESAETGKEVFLHYQPILVSITEKLLKEVLQIDMKISKIPLENLVMQLVLWLLCITL